MFSLSPPNRSTHVERCLLATKGSMPLRHGHRRHGRSPSCRAKESVMCGLRLRSSVFGFRSGSAAGVCGAVRPASAVRRGPGTAVKALPYLCCPLRGSPSKQRIGLTKGWWAGSPRGQTRACGALHCTRVSGSTPAAPQELRRRAVRRG